MLFSAPLLLSFVASALAYTVTEPSSAKGWSAVGPQSLSWDRVATDPSTFAVVLTSTDGQVEQVLNAQVDGNLLSIPVNPPSGGWPQGQGFRVNLVKDVNHVNTILAQSSDFSIGVVTSSTAAASSAVSSGASQTLPVTTPLNSTARPTTAVTPNVSNTATATGSAATFTSPSSTVRPVSSSSASATTSTNSQNAASKNLVHVGFAPLLLALPYFL